MKEVLKVIVDHLVDNTDKVHINESLEDDLVVLELTVADDDIGKVIGKQGRIAKAIRSVVKSCASYQNKKVIVKIM